jgi:hypothetical protein
MRPRRQRPRLGGRLSHRTTAPWREPPRTLRRTPSLTRRTAATAWQAVVKTVDMSEEMEKEAIDLAATAMNECLREVDMAGFIKKEFDKKYRRAAALAPAAARSPPRLALTTRPRVSSQPDVARDRRNQFWFARGACNEELHLLLPRSARLFALPLGLSAPTGGAAQAQLQSGAAERSRRAGRRRGEAPRALTPSYRTVVCRRFQWHDRVRFIRPELRLCDLCVWFRLCAGLWRARSARSRHAG